MLRNIFLVSLLIYAVCAAHWEIREVDSAEDQDEEISADSMSTQQIFNKCDICKKIMKAVKKKLSANATPHEIKEKLNNACNKLKLVSGQCKKLVQKYLHAIIDELMTEDGPNTICTKIHACKSNPPIKEFIFVHDQAHDNF
ncbi:antimicrobial peptide NK-lysin-like [Carassius auratus]|uniref:Antimicrobial peptide NK-lysin-like n=1 Tax=Carassius auratus TaxID=7957 RepID=A0A6P6R998_CARAU|nr:antimicrobial peptide NK-lysin-like [Carassius auratus]XP_052435851.1 antimicrobial peptide NK-lysin isoform X4 [Carassius gibelio]